jgi:hypothetical protein
MLKKILSMLLALTFLAVLPALSGCEEPQGDRISVEKKTTVKDVPVGQTGPKLTGD